jgi:GNAT superfamily N-acetyltransferase
MQQIRHCSRLAFIGQPVADGQATREGTADMISDLPGLTRRLLVSDMVAFRAHLLRLDPESRRSRFAMGVSDAFLEQYAETSFRLDGVAYGYFEVGVLRAVAELRPLSEHELAEMEAAFSVEAGWQRKGIGSVLFKHVIDAARRRRVSRLYTTCLSTNAAMKALALKFDGELSLQGRDVMAIIEPAPAPSFANMIEATELAAGFAIAVLDVDRWWRKWR